MITDAEIASGLAAVGERVTSSLHEAHEVLSEWHPLQPEDVDVTSTKLIYADSFALRFSRAQDFVGKTIFRAVLMAEGTRHPDALDPLLTMMEERQIVAADSWREVRKVRSALSHGYPDTLAEAAKAVNTAFALTPLILKTFDRARAFITSRTGHLLPPPT